MNHTKCTLRCSHAHNNKSTEWRIFIPLCLKYQKILSLYPLRMLVILIEISVHFDVIASISLHSHQYFSLCSVVNGIGRVLVVRKKIHFIPQSKLLYHLQKYIQTPKETYRFFLLLYSKNVECDFWCNFILKNVFIKIDGFCLGLIGKNHL